MIRTLALAAAAAAVGYLVGRRVSDDNDEIGTTPTPPTGNAVGVSKEDIENTRHRRVAFDEEEGLIGR